jgi:serine protease
MRPFRIVSLDSCLHKARQFMYFCILTAATLVFSVPIIFYYDFRNLSMLMDDGIRVEKAGKRNSFANAETASISGLKNIEYTPKTQSGQDVIVVIADSGIDLGNDFFKPFLWTNKGEVENGLDDDGNGCVDDIHGCSFGTFTSNGNIQDDVGHGTHIAGIIAGASKPSVKLAAEQNRIHFVIAKCMPEIHYSVNCPAAVDYAIWLKQTTGFPVAINFSLTWPFDPMGIWETAVVRANNHGIMIIASAGNSEGGYMRYPASLSMEYDNVISVASVNDDGKFADYSSKYADIAALGGSGIESINLNGKSTKTDGTSVSAPLVTQVVLLLMQQMPNVPPSEIKNGLMDGSEKRPNLESVVKQGRVLDPIWTLESVLASTK